MLNSPSETVARRYIDRQELGLILDANWDLTLTIDRTYKQPSLLIIILLYYIMETPTHYQLYKESNEKWRKANQEHVNEYYRKYHAERRLKKKEAEHRQITLEYLQKQINNN